MKAVLAALLAALLFSQTARAAPAIWEARDADSRILLFGSVHLLPTDVQWRTATLNNAVAASEHVYFEADIGPRGIAALTIKLMVATIQSASNPWLDLLSDEQLAQLSAALEPLGMSLEEAGRLAPWLVSMQLAQRQLTAAPEARPGDFAPDSGVEWVLQWELPVERKAYLETPGQQFDLLAQGTLAEQVEQLFAALAESTSSSVLDEIISAWSDGDVDRLANLTAPASEADEMVRKLMLTDRNRNWLPALERLLAENREDLVVVGAAHLAGKDSVLDLLTDAGYTVNRIQ